MNLRKSQSPIETACREFVVVRMAKTNDYKKFCGRVPQISESYLRREFHNDKRALI